MKRKFFGCFLVLSLIQASISYAQQETLAQGSEQTKIINTQLEVIKSQINQEDVSKQELPTELQSLIINPVIVTATKFPTQMDKTGEIVRVISRQELESLGVSSLKEALGLISNVSVASASGIDSIYARGNHSGATKVLLNGIDLSDPIGIQAVPAFDTIAFNSIDRIEVVSGGQGTIYGSGALAGVINIISKDVNDATSVNIEYDGSAYNLDANFATKIGDTFVSVMGNSSYDNSSSVLVNTDEIDKRELYSVTIQGLNKSIYNGSLGGSYTYNTLYQELDQDNIDDPNYDTNRYHHLSNIYYEKVISSKLLSRLSYSKTALKRTYLNESDSVSSATQESTYNSTLDKVVLDSNYSINETQNLIAGLDFTKETGSSSGSWGTYSSQQDTTRQYFGGLFAQHYWENNIIDTNLGARLERYGSDKTILTYSTAFSKTIKKLNLTGIVGLKSGYRAGSLYERFDSGNGNNEIEAEESFTVDYSLIKPIKFADIKLSIYDQEIKNYIDWKADRPGAWTGKYSNLDGTTTFSGVELSIQTKPFKNVQFLRLEAADINAKDINGNRLARRADYKATLSGAFKFDKLTVGTGVYYLGTRIDAGKELPSYVIADTKFSYTISKTVQVYAKVYNLLNKQYMQLAQYPGQDRRIFIGYSRQF